MKKSEYIEKYGPEAYEVYKKKQKLLTKKWRENNKEKARKYGREYYSRLKKLAMLAMNDGKDRNI